jgi:hypothetical protein
VFRDLAKLAYPFKTVAALGDVTARAGEPAGRTTIKDWLRGKHAPPHWVLAIVTSEIMRRLSSR